MTLSHHNPNLDSTIPDNERYPMIRGLVDDVERYLNPETHTPSRHDRVEQAHRFYVTDDNLYVGQSLSVELAARRNSPLLIFEETTTYPDILYNTTEDTCSFLDYLDESTHREVIVCIDDVTTVPTDAFQALAEILTDCTFNPHADAHTDLLDTPDQHEPVTGSRDNLIVLASEPASTFLDNTSDTIRQQFSISIDPDRHDGYTDKAFTRLEK